MTDLIAPIVNLNGTSRETLLAQYLAIDDAFVALHDAIRQAMPNGRDYQTVAKGTDIAARGAFILRLQALVAMQQEFEAVALSIAGVEA